MQLQTQISIDPEHNPIDYSSKVLLMGSCFAEHIGEHLDYFKFQHLCNPFGIVFHPVAIEKLVTRAINEELYSEKDIFFQNEQWYCFEAHSCIRALEKDEILDSLNKSLHALKEYVLSASHMVFTYGTAWVYRFIESDSIVANCHKIPQKKFLKELLSVDEISASLENLTTLIRSVNPKVVIIHTVSPVRHLKDGFVENTRSKAHLIAGTHEQIEPRHRNHYFPSFEMLMDELRDYRFYREDMLHPNSTAIKIVWQKFNSTWIASETNEIRKEIAAIQSGLEHRPFHEDSEAHQLFLKGLQKKIALLQERFPQLKF